MKKIVALAAGIACLMLGAGMVPAKAQNVIQGTWTTQANAYSSNIGQRYTFYFPPGGSISSRIWGTDIYTYDCSIASAAVHAGLINTQNGGTVTIEIRPGQSSYRGSARNGVTSYSWGAFGGSFVFVGANIVKPITPVTPVIPVTPVKPVTPVTPVTPSSSVIQGTWTTQANAYSGNIGQRYTFYFPSGGTISSRIWGTDIYTYDCSIASAAVHAGLITAQNGGTVTIEIRPGQLSYRGSVRNGVTSYNWGAFGGSFVFVGSNIAKPITPVTPAIPVTPVTPVKPVTPVTPVTPSSSVIQGTWTTQANAYSGNIGQRYTFYFPPGGSISSRIWGTDMYTYDCSIASAAVHAGLINTQNGGTVTIEIRPGQSSYQGSVRNGVTSYNWGAFGGSFVFVR